MIAVISTGSYTYGMVNYNHKKTNEKQKGNKSVDKGAFLGVNKIVNTSFETIVSTINDCNNANKNISEPCIHISLNFHKNDILSNEEIFKITQDYMENMGYGEQPYAVYRHFDKEHPHVHIVSSQVNYENGKKINDSHLYYRSQALTRKLEDKYSITKAVGKNEVLDKENDLHSIIHEHLEFGKHSLTAILKKAISDVLENKPTSEKQFEYLLSSYQIKRIISNDEENKPKGHFFDLRPIELLGLNEEEIKEGKISKGVYGSDLDISFGYEAVLAQIHINNLSKEALQKNIMGRIYSIVNPMKTDFERSSQLQESGELKELNQFKKIKLTDLITFFKKKGIQLEIKRTQTGDDPNSIFGLLFKDIRTSHTYSASEIKLKTKDFLKLVDDDLKSLSKEETKTIIDDMNDKYSFLTAPNFNDIYNEGREEKLSSVFDLAISLFDSNIVTPNQEEQPKRKPRRKKR